MWLLTILCDYVLIGKLWITTYTSLAMKTRWNTIFRLLVQDLKQKCLSFHCPRPEWTKGRRGGKANVWLIETIARPPSSFSHCKLSVLLFISMVALSTFPWLKMGREMWIWTNTESTFTTCQKETGQTPFPELFKYLIGTQFLSDLSKSRLTAIKESREVPAISFPFVCGLWTYGPRQSALLAKSLC